MTIKHDGSIERAIKQFIDYKSMKEDTGIMGEVSPLPELDSKTNGIIKGKVYTIAGYSNTGKSKLAYQYVNHFLGIGKKVIFFSLEVDSGMVLWNLMCNKYNKHFNYLDGTEYVEWDFDWLQIYDTVYHIGDMIDIVEKEKPDYVFVDFVQNVQCEWHSEYERMSTIARDIQQMAIQFRCTVFSLSQMSNTMGKQLSNWDMNFVALKGAGELYASSDVVFVISPMWTEQIQIGIVKNKFWPKINNIILDVNFGKWVFAVSPEGKEELKDF